MAFQTTYSNPINMTMYEGGKVCLVGRNETNEYNGLMKSPDPGNLNSLYTIVIEGNVASGKTTFVDMFKGYSQVLQDENL